MPMHEQNLHRAVSSTSSTSPMKTTTVRRTTPGPRDGFVQQLLRLAVASTTTATSCGGPWLWSFLVQLHDGGRPRPGTCCNDIASSTTVKHMGAGVLLVSAFQVRLQQQKKATTMKKRVIQTKRGGGQNAPAQNIPKYPGAPDLTRLVQDIIEPKPNFDSLVAATSTSLLSTQSSSHLDVCASETATCAQGKYREPVKPLCKCPEAKPLCLMVHHFHGRCFESKEACQKDETLLVDEQYQECLTVGEHMRCPECLENANVKRAVTEELCVAHDACVTAVWDKEKMGEPPLSQTGLPFPEDEELPLLEALEVQQGKSTVAEAICCPSDKSATTSGESSEIVLTKTKKRSYTLYDYQLPLLCPLD